MLIDLCSVSNFAATRSPLPVANRFKCIHLYRHMYLVQIFVIKTSICEKRKANMRRNHGSVLMNIMNNNEQYINHSSDSAKETGKNYCIPFCENI